MLEWQRVAWEDLKSLTPNNNVQRVARLDMLMGILDGAFFPYLCALCTYLNNA